MVQPSSSPKPSFTRISLLAICLLLFVGGILLRYAELVEPGSRKFVADSLLKVSMVVGLAWLAAPQLERLGWQRLRGTGLAIIIIVGGITAVRPRFGAMVPSVLHEWPVGACARHEIAEGFRQHPRYQPEREHKGIRSGNAAGE